MVVILVVLVAAAVPFFLSCRELVLWVGWGSACAQLEQSIKNGRDIRPGNCRPFLSGSRRCAEGGRTEQSAAAKEGVLAPAHSLGGVVRRHFFVAPRSPWAHFTAT